MVEPQHKQPPTPADAQRQEVILCVDDEPSALAVLQEQLEEAFGADCDVAVAQSGEEALAVLDTLDPEQEVLAVVIVDQIMPGMTGTELLEVISGRAPDAMKILLTGQAGLDAVVHAINTFGLHQYIAKPWDAENIRLAVEGLLHRFRLREQNARLVEHLQTKNAELAELNATLEEQVRARTRALEQANERLAKLAITDGLTGLYNHRHFQERLAQEVARSGRSGEPVALVMIDVDHFKAYNDANGHQAGDEALRTLAATLSAGRRMSDVVARYGGEELAVVLPGTDRRSAALVGEYLRRRVADKRFPGEESQPGGRLTLSAGVAACPEDAHDPASLIQAADEALYRAKGAGRNQVVAAGPAEETENQRGE